MKKRITATADESSTIFIDLPSVSVLCSGPFQCREINYMYNWRKVDVASKNLIYVALKHWTNYETRIKN